MKVKFIIPAAILLASSLSFAQVSEEQRDRNAVRSIEEGIRYAKEYCQSALEEVDEQLALTQNAECSRVDVIKSLLSHRRINVNKKVMNAHGNKRFSPLYLAIEAYAADWSVDGNYKTFDANRAKQKKDQHDVVNLLIQHGADLNEIIPADANENRRESVLEKLVNTNYDDTLNAIDASKLTPEAIELALNGAGYEPTAITLHPAFMDKLLTAGGNPDMNYPLERGYYLHTPLIESAIKNETLESVNLLASKYKVDLEKNIHERSSEINVPRWAMVQYLHPDAFMLSLPTMAGTSLISSLKVHQALNQTKHDMSAETADILFTSAVQEFERRYFLNTNYEVHYTANDMTGVKDYLVSLKNKGASMKVGIETLKERKAWMEAEMASRGANFQERVKNISDILEALKK